MAKNKIHVVVGVLLGLSAGCSSAPVAQTKPVALDFEAACERSDKTCINAKVGHFQDLCGWDPANASSCYKFGLAREEAGHPVDLILQVHHIACQGGEKRACDAEIRLSRAECIRIANSEDRKCYTMPEPAGSPGAAFVSALRSESEYCVQKLKTNQSKCNGFYPEK